MSKEELKSSEYNCLPKGRESYNTNINKNMGQNKKQNKNKSLGSYDTESEEQIMVKQDNRTGENLNDSSRDSDLDELNLIETDISKPSSPIQKQNFAKNSLSTKQKKTKIRAQTSSTIYEHTYIEDQIVNTNVQKCTTSPQAVSPIAVSILFLVGSVAIYFANGMCNVTNKPDIEYMRETYPWTANETWDNIEAVIDDILQPSAIHPAVFLFLYNSKTANINDLVYDLAKYASDKLENGGDFIEMTESEFHSEEAISDYGYLIDKYAQEITEKKVMVVRDLQNIPGQVAQAFHSFCDEISPLAESVVYIFTLKVNSLHGKKETIAEYYLKESWKDLDEDILMPLVTRVTGSVF